MFQCASRGVELVVVTGRQSAASSDFDPVVSRHRGSPDRCKRALEQTGAGVDFEEVHLFAVGPPFHANRQLVRSIGVEISIPVPQLQGQGRPGKKQQGLGFEGAGGPGPAQPAVGLEDPQGAVVEQGVGQVERGRGDLAAFRGVERETHQGAVLRQRIAGGGQDDLEGVEIGAGRVIHLENPVGRQVGESDRCRSRGQQVGVIGHEKLDRDDALAGDPGQPHRKVDARSVRGRRIGQDQPRARGSAAPGCGGLARTRRGCTGPGGRSILGGEVGQIVAGVRPVRGPGETLAGLHLRRRSPLAGVVLACISVLKGVDDLVLGIAQLNRVGAVLPVDVGGEVPVSQGRPCGIFVGHDQQAVRGNGRPVEGDGAIGLPVAAVDAHQAPAVESRPGLPGDFGECLFRIAAGPVVKHLLNAGRGVLACSRVDGGKGESQQTARQTEGSGV